MLIIVISIILTPLAMLVLTKIMLVVWLARLSMSALQIPMPPVSPILVMIMLVVWLASLSMVQSLTLMLVVAPLLVIIIRVD